MLMEIKATIISVAVALLIGAAVSWHFTDKYHATHALSQEVSSLKDQRSEVQADIKQADKDDVALNARIVSAQARLSTFQKDVKQYVPTQKPTASAPQTILLGRDLLTSGTVCVLNVAREGLSGSDSSCDSDGTGSTTSQVDAEDLIDNDLAITARYWQLKAKYDALRDTVGKFQQRTEIK